MKKSFLIGLLFIFSYSLSISQSWQTTSKSCGSCGGAVSIYSKVGDYCPHCHVRWGYENSTYRNSYSGSYGGYGQSNYYTPSYVSVGSYAETKCNTNLRKSASKKSAVITVIPAYSDVYVISENGNWYYVKYKHSYYNSWNGSWQTETLYGWVYYTLLE